MPMTGRTIVTENLKTILLCINSYDDLLISGTLYHPSLKGGKDFSNLMQFTLAVEGILDNTGFPRATTEKRRFNSFEAEQSEESLVGKPLDFHTPRGAVATFRLKIMFRQNASWQGSLAWMETGHEEPFRSALEFFMLLDSALQCQVMQLKESV